MWLVLWGCTEPEPFAPPPDTDDPSTPSSPASTAETGTSTADTAPATTADTAVAVDCTAVPSTGTFVREHEYVPSFEDFTFDAEGYLWGISITNGNLVRIPLDGPPELLRPAIVGFARGTRFLIDGDLAVVDYLNGAVIRVDRTTYGSSLIVGSLSSPNGIAVATDGFVFLSGTNGQVHRIDPDTGASTLVVDSPTGGDGITFAPDYQRMYLASDLDGSFATFVVDAAGTLTEPLSRIADLPGSADGMTMDACGNAYVAVIDNRTIEQVAPDGTHHVWADLPSGYADGTVTAVNFGSGVGGWERDHLYLGGPGMNLYELDAGVEGKWEPQYP